MWSLQKRLACVLALAGVAAVSACSADDAGLPTADDPEDGGSPQQAGDAGADVAMTVDDTGAPAVVEAGSDAQADAGPLTAQQIAAKLIASKKLRSLPVSADQPDYIPQIEAIANGTASANCGIDIRVLQFLLRLTEKYTTVGVSDINRKCANILAGAGTQSSHWIDGGGKAIDIWALNGTPINGSNALNIEMLKYAYTFMPNGTRIGQSNCRSAAQNAMFPNFGSFSDSCNHTHLDVATTSGKVSGF